MMRYIIYQRVSTDRQEIDTQRKNCQDYIRSQPIKAPVRVFSDPDTTSKIPMEKRVGLQEMLSELQKEDIVVISNLDRLARDIRELVVIGRAIRHKGADFYSLTQGSVPDWQLGIYGSVAQLERENVSKRVKARVKILKREEERAGYIPYGYMLKEPIKRTKENKGTPIKIIENPQEQHILQEINILKEQGIAYRSIAYILNERGYQNRIGNRNRTGSWTHNAVARIHVNASRRSLAHTS